MGNAMALIVTEHESNRVPGERRRTPWLAVVLVGFAWSGCERGITPAAGPLVVHVTGEAYEWHIAYPGGDGVHGTTDDRHTLGSLHAPAGRPLVIELRSHDLLYTFGIPRLDIKEIAVPDLVYTVEFTPTSSGTFVLRGDQLCGYRHESLIGELVIESPVELERWLSSLPRGSS